MTIKVCSASLLNSNYALILQTKMLDPEGWRSGRPAGIPLGNAAVLNQVREMFFAYVIKKFKRWHILLWSYKEFERPAKRA